MSFNLLINYTCKISLLILFFLNPSQAQEKSIVFLEIQMLEYDDPKVTALKENIKKNAKVKAIESSFIDNIIKFSIDYPGSASVLWEEISPQVKKNYKLIKLDKTLIVVSGITISTTKPSPIQTKAPADKTSDSKCFECNYFPLCKYDVTISYNGELFKGVRLDDNSIVYYHCENGIVTKRWETTEKILKGNGFTGYWEDEIKKSHNLIILKSDLAEGLTWEQKDDNYNYSYKIAKRETTLNYNGSTYKDVIIVQVIINVSTSVLNTPDITPIEINNMKISAYNHFYAKGIGYIKSDDIYQKLVEEGKIDIPKPNETMFEFLLSIYKAETER